MDFKKKHDLDKLFMYVGWLISSCTIFTGVYFLWPYIHIALLGFALIYLGMRIFNFSTFDEHEQKRMDLLNRLFNNREE